MHRCRVDFINKLTEVDSVQLLYPLVMSSVCDDMTFTAVFQVFIFAMFFKRNRGGKLD